MKKTIRDVDVAEKRVLVRVDFNVHLEDSRIVDDTRIRESLPTIRYLIDHRARVMILSHLGRPAGFVVEKLRMNPVAQRLAELLDQPVAKVNNCIGPEVQEAVKNLLPGQVLFLENVRFHPGEMVNDAHFAARLASSAELFVNDAFATANRAHASTVGITRYLPAVAGLLMEKELLGLRDVLQRIQRPVYILLGGKSLVDKARFINDTLNRGALVLFGGVLANTMLHAQGLATGQSQVETEAITLAREFLAGFSKQIGLPTDVVISDSPFQHSKKRVVSAARIPPAGYIVDIGPETIARYSKTLANAGTIIWNGIMGTVEASDISEGTQNLATKIANQEGVLKLVGGGETKIVLDHLGLTGSFDYISTGGAAFLDGLNDKTLPAVLVLLNKEDEVVEKNRPEKENKESRGGPLRRQEERKEKWT